MNRVTGLFLIFEFTLRNHLRQDVADGCCLARARVYFLAGDLCRQLIEIGRIRSAAHDMDPAVGASRRFLDSANRASVAFRKGSIDDRRDLAERLRHLLSGLQAVAFNRFDHENKQHGTYDFPFEFYHVDQNHPQYIMSYHWHSEYEIIRILTGELRVTLDEKTVEAKEGDILFVNGGVLHAAMPAACVYECLVFDLDSFQHSTTVCRTMMQEIADHTVLVDDFFPPEAAGIHQTVWNIFDTMKERAEGYELSVFGLLYAFFGQIYSTHSYHVSQSENIRAVLFIFLAEIEIQRSQMLDFQIEEILPFLSVGLHLFESHASCQLQAGRPCCYPLQL